jgi:hypothetical protein
MKAKTKLLLSDVNQTLVVFSIAVKIKIAQDMFVVLYRGDISSLSQREERKANEITVLRRVLALKERK